MTAVRRARAPRRRPARSATSDHVARNRREWDATSEEYERRHHKILGASKSAAWGVFRVPETRLALLGPVRGRRILELGCGAGRWSATLVSAGGLPIGLDVSANRLAQARLVQSQRRRPFPLVRADAEHLPFRDLAFDVVFCDWGAMTFCDPYETVPEVARVLRPGGVFSFSNSSPFRTVAQDRGNDRIGRSLRYDYFGLHRASFPRETNFQLEYGEWIRLFRQYGLWVDRLIEPRSPHPRRSSYLSAEAMRWGRRWPIESIWRLLKEASTRQAER